MVLDGVEVLLCPRSQEEKQEWLECLRAAGYVSEQALIVWNGMEYLTISQNRMDSISVPHGYTVQWTHKIWGQQWNWQLCKPCPSPISEANSSTILPNWELAVYLWPLLISKEFDWVKLSSCTIDSCHHWIELNSEVFSVCFGPFHEIVRFFNLCPPVPWNSEVYLSVPFCSIK